MREDLIQAAAAAGAEADRLIAKARALPPAERGPMLDEADRLVGRAAEYNILLSELAADRLGTLVAHLTQIAQEETARASSIRASAEALVREARELAGMSPGGGAAPAGAGAMPPGGGAVPAPQSPGFAESQAAFAVSSSPIPIPRPAVQPAPAGPAPGPSFAPAAPAARAGAAARVSQSIDPDKKDSDLQKLHPAVRKKVQDLMAALEQAGVPMRVFEAHRPPERQRHLFGQGRTRPGSKVTKADAWQSYHQYGMAVDMIINRPGINPWEDRTPETRAWWTKYHALANEVGLEPLSFEKPHVQIADMTLADLRAGRFPSDGDESWRMALDDAVRRFPDGAPHLGAMPAAPERPPLPQLSGFDGLPARDACDWTCFGGGAEYRLDAAGVLLRRRAMPLRSDGPPLTVGRIVELYGEQIARASRRHKVPPELILMTIATEAGAFRKSDFTGERTFRWESGSVLSETGDPEIEGARHRGDYSAGPMQVMSTTARWINRVRRLGHDPQKEFAWFKRKPASAPNKLGLYDGEVAIDVGAAYIAYNRETHNTGNDPVLVSACYNAGSLKSSSSNVWGLVVYGDHLDRATRWYGDACEVMSLAGR